MNRLWTTRVVMFLVNTNSDSFPWHNFLRLHNYNFWITDDLSISEFVTHWKHIMYILQLYLSIQTWTNMCNTCQCLHVCSASYLHALGFRARLFYVCHCECHVLILNPLILRAFGLFDRNLICHTQFNCPASYSDTWIAFIYTCVSPPSSRTFYTARDNTRWTCNDSVTRTWQPGCYIHAHNTKGHSYHSPMMFCYTAARLSQEYPSFHLGGSNLEICARK